MKFRPCIDIHNGKVKQIVGGSLMDQGDFAKENFVSEKGGDYYGALYRKHGLSGGHIILLNPAGSNYYEEDVKQAERALLAYPDGLMIGGGMNADNAKRFLEMGATHVIVTSYVFKDGQIYYDHLTKIKERVGKKHLVLDLSCRKKDGAYYVVTDRWQKFTNVRVEEAVIQELSSYCDEFLIHAVDVEGKANGIEEELVSLLAKHTANPITYAGGVSSLSDVRTLKRLSHNRMDVTIGSALDLFGGALSLDEVLAVCKEPEEGEPG